MSQIVKKFESGGPVDQVKLFTAGDKKVDLNQIISGADSKLGEYLSKTNWNQELKNAFLQSYKTFVEGMKSGDISERGYDRRYIDNRGRISNKKKGFDADGAVATYFDTVIDSMDGYKPKEKEKFAPKAMLRFVDDLYGGRTPESKDDLKLFIDMDTPDKDGKRSNLNRSKYIASILQKELEDILNKDYDYEGAKFDKNTYITKLNEAIQELNNDNFGNKDFVYLSQLGFTPQITNALFNDGTLLDESQKTNDVQKGVNQDKDPKILLKNNLTSKFITPLLDYKDLVIQLSNVKYDDKGREKYFGEHGNFDSFYQGFFNRLNKGDLFSNPNMFVDGSLKASQYIQDRLGYLYRRKKLDNYKINDQEGYFLPTSINENDGTVLVYNPLNLTLSKKPIYKVAPLWENIQKRELSKLQNGYTPNEQGFIFQQGGTMPTEEDILRYQEYLQAQQQQQSQDYQLNPQMNLTYKDYGNFMREISEDYVGKYRQQQEAMKAARLAKLQKQKEELMAKASSKGYGTDDKGLKRYKASLRVVTGDKSGEFQTEDYLRFGAIALDIAALVASFLPGYGTAASAGLSLTSMLTDLSADIADDSVSASKVWTNLGTNLAFGAAGLIPGGKSAGIVKKLIKYAPKIVALGSAGVIAMDKNVQGSFGKLMNGDDLTVDDWKNIGMGVSAAAGLGSWGARKLKMSHMKSVSKTNPTKTAYLKTKEGEKIKISEGLLSELKKELTVSGVSSILKKNNIDVDESSLLTKRGEGWKVWKPTDKFDKKSLSEVTEDSYDLSKINSKFNRNFLGIDGWNDTNLIMGGLNFKFGSLNPYTRMFSVKPKPNNDASVISNVDVASEVSDVIRNTSKPNFGLSVYRKPVNQTIEEKPIQNTKLFGIIPIEKKLFNDKKIGSSLISKKNKSFEGELKDAKELKRRGFKEDYILEHLNKLKEKFNVRNNLDYNNYIAGFKLIFPNIYKNGGVLKYQLGGIPTYQSLNTGVYARWNPFPLKKNLTWPTSLPNNSVEDPYKVQSWFDSRYKLKSLTGWNPNLNASKAGLTITNYNANHGSAGSLDMRWRKNLDYTINELNVTNDIQSFVNNNNITVDLLLDIYNGNINKLNDYFKSDLTYKTPTAGEHNRLFKQMYSSRSKGSGNTYDIGYDDKLENIMGSSTWLRIPDQYEKEFDLLTRVEKMKRVHRIKDKNGNFINVYKKPDGQIGVLNDLEYNAIFNDKLIEPIMKQKELPLGGNGEAFNIKAQKTGVGANTQENNGPGLFTLFGNFLKNNSNNINNGLKEALPFLRYSKLMGTLKDNYELSMNKLNPVLVDTFYLHRNTYGDLATKQQLYSKASQIESRAAKPLTSDGSLQLANQLESRHYANQHRTQGDLADNEMVRRTGEASWGVEADNIKRYSETANTNKQLLDNFNREKLGLTTAYNQLKSAYRDIFLQELHHKLEQKDQLRKGLEKARLDYNFQQNKENAAFDYERDRLNIDNDQVITKLLAEYNKAGTTEERKNQIVQEVNKLRNAKELALRDTFKKNLTSYINDYFDFLSKKQYLKGGKLKVKVNTKSDNKGFISDNKIFADLIKFKYKELNSIVKDSAKNNILKKNDIIK